MFMMFDMKYILIVMIPGFIMSGLASLMVKSAFNKYSQVSTRRGYTGAQAAQIMLENAGILDVRIVPTNGFLSDYYNPGTKTLALSEQVFGSRSIAAVGVACHEAGHAVQHAVGYAPLGLRSAIVPIVSFGAPFTNTLLMLGLFLDMRPLLLLGIAAFAIVVLFQLITLPVEINASARAKRLCVETGIIDAEERVGVDRVLNAAALTYVAAFVSSLLTLLYYLWRAGLIGGRRND